MISPNSGPFWNPPSPHVIQRHMLANPPTALLGDVIYEQDTLSHIKGGWDGLFSTFEAPGLSNRLPKAETSRAGP